MLWTKTSTNIIDLLQTAPSQFSFAERVRRLHLSPSLTDRIDVLHQQEAGEHQRVSKNRLTEREEKELAGEVLLYRHAFTNQICQHRAFRQAALTVIQNIYLFQHRKIFFGTTGHNSDGERQEALLLLSRNPAAGSVPLAKTFQHLIIARVWNRIISRATPAQLKSADFLNLHAVVEHLNTLRNIYMLLSMGLVRKLVSNINAVYEQSISYEDAVQIGSFGVARAAYRYHPSSGVRFSTYAARWIQKEIQRQALAGRLVKISAARVEEFARKAKQGHADNRVPDVAPLQDALPYATLPEHSPQGESAPGRENSPLHTIENRQLRDLITTAIDKVLSPKSGDIIKRRYGLSPYIQEQSVIDIGRTYGVTRGSIYQLEQTALRKLKQHLTHHSHVSCS